MNSYLVGLIIVVVACLQVIAWLLGQNGGVFAFTSLIIGGLAGLSVPEDKKQILKKIITQR